MKTPTVKDQERRRIRLVRLCKSVEEFIQKAQTFPRHYGFPGMGSRADYENFFRQVKTGKP